MRIIALLVALVCGMSAEANQDEVFQSAFPEFYCISNGFNQVPTHTVVSYLFHSQLLKDKAVSQDLKDAVIESYHQFDPDNERRDFYMEKIEEAYEMFGPDEHALIRQWLENRKGKLMQLVEAEYKNNGDVSDYYFSEYLSDSDHGLCDVGIIERVGDLVVSQNMNSLLVESSWVIANEMKVDDKNVIIRKADGYVCMEHDGETQCEVTGWFHQYMPRHIMDFLIAVHGDEETVRESVLKADHQIDIRCYDNPVRNCRGYCPPKNCYLYSVKTSL